MNRKDAIEILKCAKQNEDKCCTCFQGHAPCGYCETNPCEETIKEAWQKYEEHADWEIAVQCQNPKCNILFQVGLVDIDDGGKVCCGCCGGVHTVDFDPDLKEAPKAKYTGEHGEYRAVGFEPWWR